ncbi:MAG: hypothetical protein IJ446_06255 [Oscillospiraceae bacterium]|nr:hypothetical protein [Oscillospiraceae bacterium]
MDDKLMESSFLRDQNFELNGERMLRANRCFDFSFRFGMTGLIMAYASAVLFAQRLTTTLAGGLIGSIVTDIMSKEYDRSALAYNISGWLCTLPIALLGPIMALFANRLYKKWASIILYIIYVLYFVIGVLGVGGVWDDIDLTIGILLMAYGIIGVWSADMCWRSLKELDYLVTQEGFPSFNLAMQYFGRSRYVKFRENWLKKEKKYDYYSEKARPVANITVTAAETPDGMDGISADAKSGEQWFENNQSLTEEEKKADMEDNAMDGIDCSALELPEDESYYRDPSDKKRRAL